ncbi:hypothetical protein BDQ17DRAFT_1331181 [Cyathus striatus]|nr:hypothetical protein BDQ17DRAFT_1331181 [Cyathus striatus]
MFMLDGIGRTGIGLSNWTRGARGDIVLNVDTGRACGDALSEGAGDGKRDGALPHRGGGGGRRRRSESEDEGRRSGAGDPCPDPDPNPEDTVSSLKVDFFGLSSSPVLPEPCLLNKVDAELSLSVAVDQGEMSEVDEEAVGIALAILSSAFKLKSKLQFHTATYSGEALTISTCAEALEAANTKRTLDSYRIGRESMLVNIDMRHWKQPARNEHSIYIGWGGKSMVVDIDIDTRRGTQQTGGNGKRWIGIRGPLCEKERKEEGG